MSDVRSIHTGEAMRETTNTPDDSPEGQTLEAAWNTALDAMRALAEQARTCPDFARRRFEDEQGIVYGPATLLRALRRDFNFVTTAIDPVKPSQGREWQNTTTPPSRR